MKIRAGFVSNSSSSSFIVTGPVMDGGVALVFKHNAITDEEQLTRVMDNMFGAGYWDDSHQTVINARKAFEKGLGVVVIDIEYGGEEILESIDRNVNTVDKDY